MKTQSSSINSDSAKFSVRKKHKCRHPEAYLFILPSYLIYLIFVMLPIIITFCFSFTNYNLNNKFDFVGVDNFLRIFRDEVFLISVKNTFVYVAFTIFPSLFLGLFLALILNGKIIGRKFIRAAFYTPYLTSMVAVSMIWLWIYNPSYGFLNQILIWIGLTPRSWLFDEKLAMGSIIIMSVWKIIGYNMIIYLAGLQNIPQQLYEAAKIDGATKMQQLINITIPLLKPVTFFLFVILSIHSFNAFDQISVMTQGGPVNSTTTIVHNIFKEAFEHYRMGYASAMGIFLLFVILVMTMINFRYGNKGTDTSIN